MRRARQWPLAALLIVLLGAAGALASGPPSTAASPALEGHWEGSIELPSGELIIRLDFSRAEDGLHGTIDIPTQGAQGLRLTQIALAAGDVRFAIEGLPGSPNFQGRLSGDTIEGTFRQGAATLPFRVQRGVKEAIKRPQEPEPPFPYRSEALSWSNSDVKLEGTLTVPEGEGPYPAVVLISGSGPQNRDEEIFGHKPFLVLADALTRRGIAVLRYDDRGVGGSTGSLAKSTSADLAGDVLAGITVLARDSRIDPQRIGLLGHSEGGLVAMLAAAKSDRPAFLVLLAAPGVPGGQILLQQIRSLSRAQHVPDELVAKRLADEEELLEILRSDRPIDQMRTAVRENIQRQVDALPAAQRQALGETDKLIQAQVDQATSRWFLGFVRSDPAAALARVKVPVLALDGSLDLQVDAKQNLAAIETALRKGGNAQVTTVELEGLNHLFQPAQTGLPQEYGEIETTIDPEVLKKIGDWILQITSGTD
jgi:pimeloyl-ACP methyl ester carboxylesterase